MKTYLTIAKEIKRLSFPLLAKSNSTSLVVLFVGINKGTVVIPDSDYEVGERVDWPNLNNSEQWTILPSGSLVTLTQD